MADKWAEILTDSFRWNCWKDNWQTSFEHSHVDPCQTNLIPYVSLRLQVNNSN